MKLILGVANLVNSYGLNRSFLNKNNFLKIIKSKYVSGIDTALSYTKPNKVLKKTNLKKKLITTKLPKIDYRNDNIEKIIFRKFESHLKNLNLKKVNSLLLHNTQIMFSKNGRSIYKALKNLKKKYRIKKIGFSVYDLKEANFLIKKYNPEILQVPINLFNNNFENLIRNNKKIFFQARSIFLQGQLLNPSRRLLKNKNIKKLLYKFNKECNDLNISKSKACIDYIRLHKNIDQIIFSVKNFEEFEIIKKAFKEKIVFKKKFRVDKNTSALLDPRKW